MNASFLFGRRAALLLAAVFCFGASTAWADDPAGSGGSGGGGTTPPPASGGGSGGGGQAKARREDVEPTTITEAKSALKTARADRDAAEADVVRLNGELATSRDENAKLVTQFESATTAANAARAERDQARAERDQAQRERDDERARAGRAEANVARLEKLAAAHGWNLTGTKPENAIASGGEPGAGAKLTVKEWDAKLAAAKDPKARAAVMAEFNKAAKEGQIANA